jgi:hypothetical protein
VIEPVGAGTITLTVSYKNKSNGETVCLSAGSGSVTEIPEVGSDKILTVLFTLPEAIPTEVAEELTYYLVFRGQLEEEEDAVIGKVIKAPVLHSVSPD